MNNNITKTALEVVPSKVTSLGIFDFKKKKNDYRSVVSITILYLILLSYAGDFDI